MRTGLDSANLETGIATLSEVFHENTKQKADMLALRMISKQRYIEFNNQKKLYDLFRKVALPQPDHMRLTEQDFHKVLVGRRSVRNFGNTPLSVQELSTFLHFSNGIRARAKDGFTFRHWASAGGFFPIDLYLTVQNVEGLAKGLYYYDPFEHCLRQIRGESVIAPLQDASLGATGFAEKAAVGLFLAADFAKTKFKYGERGYRYILLDAGHLGGNIYLLATAMGLGACAIGGFYEVDIDRILGLDGVNEGIVYLLYLGKEEPRRTEKESEDVGDQL